MSRIQDVIRKLPKPLRNKYLISFLFFIIWIIFLDDNNLIKQGKMKAENDNSYQKIYFYKGEIESDSSELYQLRNDPDEQEKFAREKFLMKKENEDIFIIREKENE